MATHPFHTDSCPESKGKVGPVLNTVVTLIAFIAPLNAIPQIWKIFETKSVENVSLTTYLMVVVTQFIWLIYGAKLSLKPLIYSSVVVIVLSGVIVFQFLLYGGWSL